MAKPLTRKERQAQTRAWLIDAAATVFARRGFHGATVEEIAAEAGFSTGAVYSNFASKEELFLALADRKVADRVAEMCAIADAAEGGANAGPEAAEQFRAFLERDPSWPILFYEFWAYGARSARIRGEFAERRQAVRDALAEMLERAADRLGFELRFPAPALATALSAALNGLAFERVADPKALDDDVFAELISAVVAFAVAGQQRD